MPNRSRPPHHFRFDYYRTPNLQAVQILLGHTKLESTMRYLSVDAEDALTPSEGTEV